MPSPEHDDVDVNDISPRAWRLLRTAAGYEQRGVEKVVDDIMQAHISMLENNTRSLSTQRLYDLYELYATELTDEQIAAIVDNF
ncbi:hypothetical protein [Haloferax profundi]|uniref:XRE family transcriptional regulator n=1 Tax=Haloferax profundi TaxID=1544718 RepID=A0A0W1SLK6_9EURY|nr:hypothetical protein [Haloferax profundi]KTG27199.1 hypothetical protein AUR66_14815 [Haloferax profundi]